MFFLNFINPHALSLVMLDILRLERVAYGSVVIKTDGLYVLVSGVEGQSGAEDYS